MIDAILTNTLLPELSRGVLNRSLEGEKLTRVTVGARPRASPTRSSSYTDIP